MAIILKVSNITADEVIHNSTMTIEAHKLVADRTNEDGITDKQVTFIVNQTEYEQIQQSGQYKHDDNDKEWMYDLRF